MTTACCFHLKTRITILLSFNFKKRARLPMEYVHFHLFLQLLHHVSTVIEQFPHNPTLNSIKIKLHLQLIDLLLQQHNAMQYFLMLIVYLHLLYISSKVRQYPNVLHCKLNRRSRKKKHITPKTQNSIEPSINGVQSCLLPRSSTAISGMVRSMSSTKSV